MAVLKLAEQEVTDGISTCQAVKVRINACGQRIIGYVHLPPGVTRMSDFLNSPEPYLMVRESETLSPDGREPFRAVLKEAISYVQALEEPEPILSLRKDGAFRWVTAELKGLDATIDGELFVPAESDMPAVLNDGRRFINLRNVHFQRSVERYDYLAVSKRHAAFLRPTQ